MVDPIGNKTAPLGQTLSFAVTATAPPGVTLTFGVQPLPLPDHASFDTATGQFSFRPESDQVGTFNLTFSVTDGTFIRTETVQITVPQPDANAATGFTGRLLDANASALGQTVPIVGATVSFLNTNLSAVSDAQGNFTLTGLPAGDQVLDINATGATPAADGSIYAGFRENVALIGHRESEGKATDLVPHRPEAKLPGRGVEAGVVGQR